MGEIIAYTVSLSSRFAKDRHLQVAWQQIFDDFRGEQILIKEQFMIGKIGCKQSWLQKLMFPQLLMVFGGDKYSSFGLCVIKFISSEGFLKGICG